MKTIREENISFKTWRLRMGFCLNLTLLTFVGTAQKLELGVGAGFNSANGEFRPSANSSVLNHDIKQGFGTGIKIRYHKSKNFYYYGHIDFISLTYEVKDSFAPRVGILSSYDFGNWILGVGVGVRLPKIGPGRILIEAGPLYVGRFSNWEDVPRIPIASNQPMSVEEIVEDLVHVDYDLRYGVGLKFHIGYQIDIGRNWSLEAYFRSIRTQFRAVIPSMGISTLAIQQGSLWLRTVGFTLTKRF